MAVTVGDLRRAQLRVQAAEEKFNETWREVRAAEVEVQRRNKLLETDRWEVEWAEEELQKLIDEIDKEIADEVQADS